MPGVVAPQLPDVPTRSLSSTPFRPSSRAVISETAFRSLAGLMDPTHLTSRNFRNVFVLLLVAAISLLVLAIAWPFLKPLLLGF